MFFEDVLLAAEMLKSEKPTFNISPVGALFWGVVCFWLGNVLLAGEMLKSAKPTFNISPVGAFFWGLCASGWGNVKKFFENVLLAGEILNKLKMLNMGGTMFVYRCLVHKHVSPHFNIFNFLAFAQSEAHFRKKFLTFPQPEAHFIFFFNFSPARSTFHFSF